MTNGRAKPPSTLTGTSSKQLQEGSAEKQLSVILQMMRIGDATTLDGVKELMSYFMLYSG
jgi:hypothetical protein